MIEFGFMACLHIFTEFIFIRIPHQPAGVPFSGADRGQEAAPGGKV
jgi:hypothetical protein